MQTQAIKKSKDPVCGRRVDPAAHNLSTVFEQQAYYFCSRGCLDRFNQDRERFVRGSRRGLKGIWSRYLDRVQKATDGKPPCCH
jgi:YHS domain-containing protein